MFSSPTPKNSPDKENSPLSGKALCSPKKSLFKDVTNSQQNNQGPLNAILCMSLKKVEISMVENDVKEIPFKMFSPEKSELSKQIAFNPYSPDKSIEYTPE
jgi:hypothetical protein